MLYYMWHSPLYFTTRNAKVTKQGKAVYVGPYLRFVQEEEEETTHTKTKQ
jgi:hypothetical protein